VDYITKPFEPIELRARVVAQFRARDLAVRLHRAEQVTSLGILTSGLAHELRNPANAIVNAIEPLVHKLPATLLEQNKAVRELVEVIRECADQIRALAKQLLGVRNGSEPLETRATPLNDVISRALLFAAQRLKSVEMRVDVGDVVIKCAPPLLTQALTNLIENAADAATGANGAKGWVDVRATTTGTAVTIAVTDSGPGVPKHLRERVFEPFFTTKAVIGTGLGLSLARQIVERHAGTLEIHDHGNSGGSAFVIHLPGVCLPATTAGAI
jgi:signal transduction histidine kinase